MFLQGPESITASHGKSRKGADQIFLFNIILIIGNSIESFTDITIHAGIGFIILFGVNTFNSIIPIAVMK